ncbi:GNAT family N-acetyltransferase [Motilibacter aurantiacus]|uniref:GNAT family N-acetyltransferase n=1 Tax=Motilibacter aurantiacus TaxID=2714955 RepID=UPI00140BF674|nr:GNAT family N-acetyltransferase [Motilibacter aurantiacus]NHC45289.1 GNAT family N-acetyltransferase [Motilibacter aurantiacus]
MAELRPMTLDDAEAAFAVVDAADQAAPRLPGDDYQPPSDDIRSLMLQGSARFVERDPDGAWVAERDGQVVGIAEAVRRGPFWGLSMLFLHPSAQGQGIGRRLLEQALAYAEGAELRMIMASTDPRALRRYYLAGHEIHPAVTASGAVDRAAIPVGLPGRPGDQGDLALVERVDAGLRGSRAEDVEFLLRTGARLEVVDGTDGSGYVVSRSGRINLLGATDERTASVLLWRALAGIEGKAHVSCLTAQQGWAVRVALAARLTVAPTGPLFVSGIERPPGPWIPNGWYF